MYIMLSYIVKTSQAHKGFNLYGSHVTLKYGYTLNSTLFFLVKAKHLGWLWGEGVLFFPLNCI